MANDVIKDIKAAEEKAHETRRVAAIAAKDSVKIAQQENAEIKDKEITQARRSGISVVEKAETEAKAELEALQKERAIECDRLKAEAEKNLSRAADICLERILR